MSQDNVARMGLRPVTASQLKGRSWQRGKLLTVTDSNGSAVVQAALGKAAYPAKAIFETTEGRWRIETGPSGVAIRDSVGMPVAIARDGEILLASDERFPWTRSSLPRVRYRFGVDLWVAKGSWLPRRFTAELSPAMLDRGDKSLLVGIASVLTQRAVERRRRLLGGAGGVGASWG